MTVVYLILLLSALNIAVSTAMASDQRGQHSLVLGDIQSLRLLEKEGARFSDLLLDACVANPSTRSLMRFPAYTDLALAIQRDVAEDRARMESHVPLPKREHLSTFPDTWLDSPSTRFELVGVVIRPDRALQDQRTCGELRFLYRLRYDVTDASSRLPMTLMLAYALPRTMPSAGLCQDTWGELTSRLGRLRAEGRGASDLMQYSRSLGRFHRVEVNVQASRLAQINAQATLEQGHYLLRIFRLNSHGRLEPELLENTIDVEKVRRSPGAREDLLRWLSDPRTLAAIDRGSMLVPPRFLAEKAISVAPYGSDRVANHPFSQVLNTADFASLDLSGYRYIRSPSALLRRLDGFSCQGCHQSRSIAGFHFLGVAENSESRFNSLWVPFSNHFLEVQEWRESLLVHGLDDSIAVPPPERSNPRRNGDGAHCGIGNDAGFSTWTCKDGYSCYASFPEGAPKQSIGTCLAKNLNGQTGQACDWGRITTYGDPLRDHHSTLKTLPCGENGICATGVNGFPNGMCFELCRQGQSYPGRVCTPGPILARFTPCLKEGKPFKECLAKHSTYALFPACDENQACRDDYVCAGVDGSSSGACMPSYTLPQLIIQFHPPL